MGKLRRVATLWNATAVGAAGKSASANIGGATYATLFVDVNAATNITVEVAPGTSGAGRNEVSGITTWYPLQKADGSGILTLTFAGSGQQALNLGAIGAEHVRLSSSGAATINAFIDSI
jgi:hypothetical protein